MEGGVGWRRTHCSDRLTGLSCPHHRHHQDMRLADVTQRLLELESRMGHAFWACKVSACQRVQLVQQHARPLHTDRKSVV